MNMPDEEHSQRRSAKAQQQQATQQGVPEHQHQDPEAGRVAQQQQAGERQAAQQQQAGQEVEVREGDAGTPQAAEPYVDPYKQVYNPLELPANTVAAQAYVDAHPDAVDPEVPISEERAAQAAEAIQLHQDRIQDTIAGVGEDPRLGGGTMTATSQRMGGDQERLGGGRQEQHEERREEHQERRAEREEQRR